MNRKDALLVAWDIANAREDWFASIRKALENVDAAEAAWKPKNSTGFNSIQEIVSHLLYYKTRFFSRLTSSDFETAADNEATFVIALAMEWEEVRQELFNTNSKIIEHLQTLEEAELDTLLPKEPIAQQVLDLASHDAYHAGQIVLIRKLQGAW